MEECFVESYNLKQAKKFIKAIKGHKFEYCYKLIMTYTLSRNELLNLEWSDIDFENKTITFYPVKYNQDSGLYKYQFEKIKKLELGRTFPLLPHIEKLLLKQREKELNQNDDFVCVRKNGLKLNANTLSRNVRMIADKEKMPQTKIHGIKYCCHDLFLKNSPNINFFRCWTRFDLIERKENLLDNIDLFSAKRFLKIIDNFLETGNLDLRSRSDAEM